MKKLNIGAIILAFVIINGGLFACKSSSAAYSEAQTVKELSAREIGLLVAGEMSDNQPQIDNLKKSLDERRQVIKNLSDSLILAAQARRDGIADEPNFLNRSEQAKKALLAGIYGIRQKAAQNNSEPADLTAEKIAAFWNNPANEEQFVRYQAAERALTQETDSQVQTAASDEKKIKRTRYFWAKTQIMAERATNDSEFLRQPDVQLRLRVLEAQLLAQEYLRRNFVQEIKATNQEITDYLAIHPEYSLQRKREKAESILQRALKGENFADLAEEFSEDRISRDNGGLYSNQQQGDGLEEIERVALSLNNGQIGTNLIQSPYGYHIIKLERKKITAKKDGTKQITYDLRQILLQNGFAEEVKNSPVPPPFVKAEEIARNEVEKEKRERLIANTAERNPINLPNDFDLETVRN